MVNLLPYILKNLNVTLIKKDTTQAVTPRRIPATNIGANIEARKDRKSGSIQELKKSMITALS